MVSNLYLSDFKICIWAFETNLVDLCNSRHMNIPGSMLFTSGTPQTEDQIIQIRNCVHPSP